jgi:cytochrome c oxidase accessory protein FixG
MFDKDTLVISYDERRGEPRGARSKSADATGLGACVDCKLCVQVCPTGIDIRKGLQYECIGCAACVDVCNSVMDKVGQPRGLVRYDTQSAMRAGLSGPAARHHVLQRMLRPRVLVYTSILLLISGAVLVSLANRLPFKVDVVRDRASLARLVEQGDVENVYRLQIMNATESVQSYRIEVDGADALSGLHIARISGTAARAQADESLVLAREAQGAAQLRLDPVAARWVSVAVRLPAETALSLAGQTQRALPVRFVVSRLAQQTGEAPGRSAIEKSTFLLPR